MFALFFSFSARSEEPLELVSGISRAVSYSFDLGAVKIKGDALTFRKEGKLLVLVPRHPGEASLEIHPKRKGKAEHLEVNVIAQEPAAIVRQKKAAEAAGETVIELPLAKGARILTDLPVPAGAFSVTDPAVARVERQGEKLLLIAEKPGTTDVWVSQRNGPAHVHVFVEVSP
jgi:Flp pilus assembly secretin CpaC